MQAHTQNQNGVWESNIALMGQARSMSFACEALDYHWSEDINPVTDLINRCLT